MGAQWKELDDDDKEPFVSAYNADKLVYACGDSDTRNSSMHE